MKARGVGLIIAGIALALIALFLPTEADSAAVYNLGMLQRQMLVFVAGCALAVAGVALAAAGTVRDALAGGASDGLGRERSVLPETNPSDSESAAGRSALIRRIAIALAVLAVIAVMLTVLATR